MNRTTHFIDLEREKNQRYARAACAMVDSVRSALTPETVNLTQRQLVAELLSVESEISWLQSREQRRRQRWRRAQRLGADRARRREEHLEVWRRRENLISARRCILRQAGDAIAWLVLRGNPRQIEPWFSDTRTHHLTPGSGLDGVMNLVEEAHRSGKYLVVVTDTTRCLGIGDICAVRANGEWIRPLIYEVKTHSIPDEQAFEIEVLGQRIPHPIDEGMHAEFQDLLGLIDGGTRPLSAKATRQLEEIENSSQRLIAITLGTEPNVPRVSRKWWSAAKAVLSQAQRLGSAFDSPEPGLAYVALQGAASHDRLDAIRQQLVRDGVFADSTIPEVISSAHVRENEMLSRSIPPIPLWTLPGAVRADLITGDLIFIAYIDYGIWEKHFRTHGVNLSWKGPQWQLSRDRSKAHLDNLEVRTVIAATAFAGASPKELVANIASTISGVERTEDQR